MSSAKEIIERYGSPSTDREEPVRSEAEALIQKYRPQEREVLESEGVVPSPTEVQKDEAPRFTRYEDMTYSQSDLTKDEFFFPIRDYMVDRQGEHILEKDREEVVELYTNNMRGFAAGNTVRAVAETSYLNDIGEDTDKLARAGEAYAIYEGLEGLFGETSGTEKAEILKDHFRSALLDPSNLFGLGVGKATMSAGMKAGSQVAMIAARKAYKRQIAKGASAETAKKAGERVFTQQAKLQARASAERVARRKQVEDQVKDSLIARVTDRRALQEMAVVGGFEGTVAAATDYLYQDALLRTKVEEEYSKYQTGLAAVAGLTFGGLAVAGTAAARGGTAYKLPEGFKETTEGANPYEDLSETIGKYTANLQEETPSVPRIGKWEEDVEEGLVLSAQDDEFFTTMLLGNDELGLKGLGQILQEQGYVWRRRSPDDKISNYIGDIIRKSDPQGFQQFIDDFKEKTGITVTRVDTPDGGTKLVDLDRETFAQTFKRKLSDAGTTLSAASELAARLGKPESQVTFNDYVEYRLSGVAPDKSTAVEKGVEKLGITESTLTEGIPNLQNNIIRLMVANLSTTVMNVAGYAQATTINSATDVTRAVLLGGKAGLLLAANPRAAKEAGVTARGIMQNQMGKLRSTLDANATYEAYLRYAEMRPEAMRELTRVLPGGVEDLSKISDAYNPERTLITARGNEAVDFIQKMNFVQAQDAYTKSIEFTSQLDKALRAPRSEGGFGMSWKEFFEQEDYVKLMQSDRYLAIEAKAVDETLKSVFSKSYKGPGLLGEVAGAIEDARNIPVVGLMVPFGRFFNNTVAFTVQNAPGSPIIAKMMGKSDKPWSEAFARTSVNAVIVGSLVDQEIEHIKNGLSWSEAENPETGEVNDYKYLFPYSAYKAAARIIAHKVGGTEMSEEEVAQISDNFVGQLTRQLGEAGEGMEGLFTTLLSDEGGEFSQAFYDAMGSVITQNVSAGTRFLEPANQLAGIARREDFQIPDRKQGNKIVNESLRYVDQLYALATGEDMAPEAFSAASGTRRLDATKMFSTARGSRLTATERVMNAVGRPAYMAGMYTMSEEADNRYNQIFNSAVDKLASNLWDSKEFQQAGLEKKQRLLDTKVMQPARDYTLTYMDRLATNLGDRELGLMIEISRGYGQGKIRNAAEDLDLDSDIGNLNLEELKTLERALKYRDEFLGVE